MSLDMGLVVYYDIVPLMYPFFKMEKHFFVSYKNHNKYYSGFGGSIILITHFLEFILRWVLVMF